MTANAHPQTYKAAFSNATNPFGDGADRVGPLQRIYHAWRSAAGPPNEADLLELTLNNFDDMNIGAIGVFVKDTDGDLRLRLIHGLKKYPGDIRTNSPLVNQVFGYLDDVDEGVAEVVAFDTDVLALTGEVNVCTVAHHKAVLVADATIEIVTARADGDPQTDTIKARKSAFIPFDMVPLVIEKNLSPRQAFLVLHPYMEAAGTLAVSTPLVDFLRVAGTFHTGGAGPLNGHDEPGKNTRIAKGLTRYMKKKVLFRDLPSLQPAVGQNDPTIAALTGAVNTMANTQLRADAQNERRRDEREQPTTIPEAFGEDNVQKLLVLCNQPASDLLPIVYTKMASKKKREDLHTIVTQAVEKGARSLGMREAPALPVATLSFIKTFRFHGIDECDIGSGMLPMSFIPLGAASAKAKARSIEDTTNAFGYVNMMGTVGQSLTSADAKELAKSKGYAVTDWSECFAQINGYTPYLVTFLGALHPVTVAYKQGIVYLEWIKRSLQRALDMKVKPQLAPALLVYYLQLKVRGWFEEQWISSDCVPAPSFDEDFRRYKQSKNLDWLPDVSDVPELRTLQAAAHPSPPPPSSLGGLVSAPQKPKRNASTSTIGERYKNPDWEQRYQEDNEFAKRVRDWRVTKALAIMKANGKGSPKTVGAKDRCVTWHGKGFCFTNCNLKYDHHKLTDDDATSFYEWCREAYA